MKELIKSAARKFYNVLAGRKYVEKSTIQAAPKGAPEWMATLTIRHEKIPRPIVHRNKIIAISMSQIGKNLKLTAKQVCDLRLRGKTVWVDINDGVHELEVKKI